jgi:DEAD/DEAH box helicase domain-containing protein
MHQRASRERGGSGRGAMTINDVLQQLARQRAGNGASPLVGMRALAATNGQRVSHLPLLPVLAQAWTTLTSEPYRPHQAAAATVARRGEPLALMADDPLAELTIQLLLYDALLADGQARALYLLPDAPAVAARERLLDQLDAVVPGAPQRSVIAAGQALRGRLPPLLLTTPALLHGHILRYHDRAWRELWGRLSVVVLADAHRYTGVAAAQIAALLLRLYRLCEASDNAPQLLVTLGQVDAPQAALEALSGSVYRVINADDGPRAATTLALWRVGGDRLRSANGLASALHDAGYSVAIAANAVDSAQLQQLVGDATPLGSGYDVLPGDVLVSVGLPGGVPGLRRALSSGHQAVLLLLGDTPEERMLHERPELLSAEPLMWPRPPANAYVDAQQLLCAASELPLGDEEVTAWGAHSLVERLVAGGRLTRLPGSGGWQPLAAAGDPYAAWSLQSVGEAVVLHDDRGQALTQLDTAQFDRWAFVGAPQPFPHGSARVARRDDARLTATLKAQKGGRRAYPLRQCEVTVREERARRPLERGPFCAWGRVLVDEHVYGYREWEPEGAREVELPEPLATQWTASAWWIELPTALRVDGQQVGWCLAGVLPLRALSNVGDVVPCYDAATRRLYFVEAQPGGNGLAAWLWEHGEALLPLTYDAALACRGDALLELIGRTEMDWLLQVLGQRQPPQQPTSSEQAVLLDLTPPRPRARAVPPEAPSPRPEPAPPLRAPVAPRDEPRPVPLAPEPPLPVVGPQANSDDESEIEDVSWQPDPPKVPDAPLASAAANGHGEDELEDISWEPDPPKAPDKPPRQQPIWNEPRPERRAPPAPAQKAREHRPAKPPPPPRAEPPPEPPAADADALVARMRREREQRDAANARQQPVSRPVEGATVEPRFATGDRVFCLPFGNGEVRASKIVRGRELLTVAFPDHGEIPIDPAVSLVRKLEPDNNHQEDEA